MLLLFVLAFSLSSCLYQSHVIIYGIVKFGTDQLSVGLSMAKEQIIFNISSLPSNLATLQATDWLLPWDSQYETLHHNIKGSIAPK